MFEIALSAIVTAAALILFFTWRMHRTISGTMVIHTEGDTKTFQMELDGDPWDLDQKKFVTFRIVSKG